MEDYKVRTTLFKHRSFVRNIFLTDIDLKSPRIESDGGKKGERLI